MLWDFHQNQAYRIRLSKLSPITARQSDKYRLSDAGHLGIKHN